MSDATTLRHLRSPYISVFVPDIWVAKNKISSAAHLCGRFWSISRLHACPHPAHLRTCERAT
jgi:hypothetical protein